MSSATEVFKLLVHSAKQVVQVVANGERVVCGEAASRVALLEQTDGTGISIVVDSCGNIHDLGTDEAIAQKYKNVQFLKKINAEGKCVLPGLVDAHTHPVWAGDRVNEFAMKLAGATYMDVHKAGGGIYHTVQKTRLATEDQLLSLLLNRLDRMLKSGTTLVEAKSGYGLDAITEMKMLRVIQRAREKTRVDISSTFCGAHAVPKGMTPEEATESVLNDQLPALKLMMDTNDMSVDNIDVFCEKGVFDVEQSRRILETGRILGLQLNFHGDELHPVGAAELEYGGY
ncbi:probable imidazolonepropionase [Uloborus diversus]|uniref:probable imidazolonepropionase n=1 Tax=Uloborus diversus TaxID=327109 RepID=UPI0024096748|nr:probable imidazolonepropionase [Uloborus diversus]